MHLTIKGWRISIQESPDTTVTVAITTATNPNLKHLTVFQSWVQHLVVKLNSSYKQLKPGEAAPKRDHKPNYSGDKTDESEWPHRN